jgi:hypothetical protein
MTIIFLDIVFQIGEFPASSNDFFASLFISIVGAFAGFMGAYWIYMSSLKKPRKDTLKYFTALLESVVSLARNQAKNVTDLSAKLSGNPTKTALLSIVASHDIKRLAERVDQQAVYHAYLKEYKRTRDIYRQFKDIYSFVDFIDMSIDELKKFVEKEYASIYIRKKEYADQFKIVKQKMQLMIIDPDIAQNYPDYRTGLIIIYDDFHANPIQGENLPRTYTEFIERLKNYIIGYNLVIEANTNIMLFVNDAIDSYLSVEQAGLSFAEELKQFDGTLKAHADNLEKTISNLKTDFSLA